MSTRRHWVEDDYEYSRPVRYANTSSNVYVTPQRYVTSYTESYSPVVRERSSRFPLFVTPARYEGKTLVRSIPSVAHQRLTTASYPPRSYVPHYEEERVLGYRVPPSSHAITTSSYRPWLEEEPMVEYMPYQPPRQIDYRPSYADTWKSTISPSTRARWNTGIEDDEDYYVDEEIDPNVYMPKTRRPRQQPPVKMVEPATTDYPGYFEEKYNDMLSTDRRVAKRAPGAMVPYRAPAISAPHYSYADKYQNDLEETLETSGVVPGNYFAARHTEPVPSIMLRRPIPKPRGLQNDHVHLTESPPREVRSRGEMRERGEMMASRGPYDDLADEYPAHGRKYVVVPMRNVYNNIYNMSYYRKPMQQANIGSKKPVARVSYFGRGAGHLACVRFIGTQAIHPTRPQKSYDIDKIPREVASLSLYGSMIAAVRDHRLVRVSLHPIHWKDDEGAPKKSRVLDISVETVPRKWRFMGGDGGLGTISPSDKITEITESKPKPKLETKAPPKVERKEEPKPVPKVEPKAKPKPEPIPEPKQEPKPEPIPEPTPESIPEPPKEEPKPEPEADKKKKKRSKGSAVEPEKKPEPVPPKEEPKPEPPKEEPKPEHPKEEPKPEPPKEEPKPEPPKEEPKPEPPKEEPKPEILKKEPTPEPPKEEPKPEPPKEEPKPEPPKQEPEPPKEEPVPEPPKEEPEPPKEEPKLEPPKEDPQPEPPKEEPEPLKEEIKSEPPVLEAEPAKEEPPAVKEETQPEPPTEVIPEPQLVTEEPSKQEPEPVTEEPKKDQPAPEATPLTEETPVPAEVPVSEVPVSEAPKEDSVPEQLKEAVPETPAEGAATEPDLAAEAEDTLTEEAQAEAARAARQAARRVSAFEEDPKWLESLSEGGGGSAQN